MRPELVEHHAIARSCFAAANQVMTMMTLIRVTSERVV